MLTLLQIYELSPVQFSPYCTRVIPSATGSSVGSRMQFTPPFAAVLNRAVIVDMIFSSLSAMPSKCYMGCMLIVLFQLFDFCCHPLSLSHFSVYTCTYILCMMRVRVRARTRPCINHRIYTAIRGGFVLFGRERVRSIVSVKRCMHMRRVQWYTHALTLFDEFVCVCMSVKWCAMQCILIYTTTLLRRVLQHTAAAFCVCVCVFVWFLMCRCFAM